VYSHCRPLPLLTVAPSVGWVVHQRENLAQYAIAVRPVAGASRFTRPSVFDKTEVIAGLSS
jgi:hypothetical protein